MSLEFDRNNAFPKGILVGNYVSLNGEGEVLIANMHIDVDSVRKKDRRFRVGFTGVPRELVEGMSDAQMLAFAKSSGHASRQLNELPEAQHWLLSDLYEPLSGDQDEKTLAYKRQEDGVILQSVKVTGEYPATGTEYAQSVFVEGMTEQREGFVPGMRAFEESSNVLLTPIETYLVATEYTDKSAIVELMAKISEDDFVTVAALKPTRGTVRRPYSSANNRFYPIHAFARYGFDKGVA